MYVRRTSCSSSHSSPSPSSIPPPDAALAASAAALASGSRSQEILDQKRGLERKAPPQHASRFCSGANPRADPGHQEHSEAAVVESREPQPRPAATCCGPVSRPGSPLCSGARGLARASLLASSRLEAAALVGGVRVECGHSVLGRRLRAGVCGCALRIDRTRRPAVPPTRLVPRALHRPPRLGIAARPLHRASVRPSAWGCPSLRVAGA
jgi:hypothetical protein